MRNKVKLYNQWGADEPFMYQRWIRDVLENDYEVIILNGLWEWEFYHRSEDSTNIIDLKNQFEKLVYDRGIRVYAIFGTEGPIAPGVTAHTLPSTTTYIYFPMFWLYCTIIYGGNRYFDWSTPATIKNVKPYEFKIDTLFLSLVNKAHVHRMEAMDRFAELGILTNGQTKNGIIEYSWHDQDNHSPKYPWKHWKTPYRKSLSDPYAEFLDSYRTTPKEMYTTALNIILESTPRGNFWTEKTFTAIANSKPFFINGGAYVNYNLKGYGFEVFEEIFDYSSIESIRDYQHRLPQTSKALQRVMFEHAKKPKALFDLLKPKTEHNLNRLIEIYNNRLLIPLPLLDLMDRYEVTWVDLTLQDMAPPHKIEN